MILTIDTEVEPIQSLSLGLGEVPSLVLEVGETPILYIDIGDVIVNEQPPIYEGLYGLTPSFNEQTLETSGLMMLNDITLDPIPVSETTTGGTEGYTISI